MTSCLTFDFIGQTPTDNIEAYTYYLRGREFLYRHSRHYFQLARRMFVKAVELDPLYARAYAGIADCDSFLFLHYHVDVGLDNILATTAKALALNDKLAEAHASRGVARSAGERHEEPPRNSNRPSRSILIRLRRIKLAERELILHPDDPRPAHLGIAALIELGETERAREWRFSRALAINPDDPHTLYNVACGYTKLGDIDSAFDLLERSLPRSGPELTKWIKHDSDFDALRSHPRYQKILELIG